jgi:hypothetical protein
MAPFGVPSYPKCWFTAVFDRLREQKQPFERGPYHSQLPKWLQRIRKGQFVLDHLGIQGQAAPAIWTAVLAD